MALASAGLAVGAGSPEAAHAQNVKCADLPAPIIYGRGGSAPNQLIGRIAVELAESNQPLTVVYKADGACFAMESLVGGAKLTGTATYWVRNAETGGASAKTCDLPTAAENPPDASWGSMAQLATTCPGIDALPADVSDGIGPISGFSLFVPKDNGVELVISAEAVKLIYGFGPEDPQYQVPPWTVPLAIASRTTTSAAGLLLAKAVGIDLSQPLYGSVNEDGSKGPNDVGSNQGAVDFITSTSQAAVDNPQAAIGFASTETADANRDKVDTLAFQAVGQNYGYWPDSTATARDKLNIRQGRYYLWNPHHFYAKLVDGQVPDPNVQRWISYLTYQEELPDGLSYLDLQIAVGTVPWCAMQVTRDGDVGPLASYQPDEPCGCYYEKKATGAEPDATRCPVCTTSTECPQEAPVCRFGYCEVK